MNQQPQLLCNQRVTAAAASRPHRPASLDIGMTRRCPPINCTRAAVTVAATPASGIITPLSAPAVCTSSGFFDDAYIGNSNSSNVPSGFELNVNVACSPAGNRGTEDGRRAPGFDAALLHT